MTLAVEDLVVAYGAVRAVQHVSITVGPGEIVAVVGPNGAGKTSLLRGISGLVRPAAGRIRLGEVDITRLPPERIVQRGLVQVPESRMIFGRMTVRENLLVGAHIRRDPTEVVRDLERIGRRFPPLAERSGQLASTLSGGERQMLAIARALMCRPALMMLDEPSLGLAPLVVREVFRLIQELNHEGMAILLVEQNARQSLRIAHRGYVMQAGRVTLAGPAEQLRRDEAVVRAYLGITQP